MPNGYRRGGIVHRNGRTHYRRSARIARPRTIAIVAFIGVGALLGGTPLIAHSYLFAGVAIVAAGIGAAWAGHRIHRARPGTVTHWAKGKLKLGVKMWTRRNPYIAAAQAARATAQQHQSPKPWQQSRQRPYIAAQAAARATAQAARATRQSRQRPSAVTYDPVPKPSRNWDRSPESPADKKFHDLRASGYKGPIDQNGNKADPDVFKHFR